MLSLVYLNTKCHILLEVCWEVSVQIWGNMNGKIHTGRQYGVLSSGTNSTAGPDFFTKGSKPFLSPSLKGNRVE